jgi:Dyp-type peroxidase family
MSERRTNSGSLLQSPDISHEEQQRRIATLKQQGKQAGIAFPSASDQTQLLIVRLNLASSHITEVEVARGLKRLCQLFADIASGARKIDVLNDATGLPEQKNLATEFHFSATVGFGEGFFDLLRIPPARRPARLKAMPDHEGLGDVTPYSLGQTDLILQLGSSSAFVNRWVLENTLEPSAETAAARAATPPDIVSAVSGWATITDVHAGFQRTDGRNLQGFNDGVSNPRAGSDQFNAVVWAEDEPEALRGGTYMVFQKVIHDLDQWRELEVDEQQEWVGRSKGTGLLLGTLEEEEDDKLADGVRRGDPKALKRWGKLFDLQAHPEIPFFSPEALTDPPAALARLIKSEGFTVAEVKKMAEQIRDTCPAWSHVRKVNPRGGDGIKLRLMFRRGYPFMESSVDNKLRSGLLFVSFQKDITEAFEFIKRQWAGEGNFPVPALRGFSPAELKARHQMGRLTRQELLDIEKDQAARGLLGLTEADDYQAVLRASFGAAELQGIEGDAALRKRLGLADDDDFHAAVAQAPATPRGQQTGREGLAGPSEHGTVTSGEFLAIMPLGGGYYFVPPIPDRAINQIGQQFFSATAAGEGTAPPRPKRPAYAGAMNVVVAPGSAAADNCRAKAAAGGPSAEAVTLPAAAPPRAAGSIPTGLSPTPEHNLLFRGGRTLPTLVFANFYVGGANDWKADDRANIDAALAAALRDPRLEDVIAQYFPRQAITATFRGPSEFIDRKRRVFSRGNVTELLNGLAQAGRLADFDLTRTVFNFLLPRGTILTTDAPAATASTPEPSAERKAKKGRERGGPEPVADVDDQENSLQGLGGYHGSVRFGTQLAYFAVGAFSDVLDDGKPNGIIAFDRPWKNVVATFYHELCEARTDPDVEEANRTGNQLLIGWTSKQREEIGDFPIFEAGDAGDLTLVFREVRLANGSGTVPIQLQYSNRVNGPEDPT